MSEEKDIKFEDLLPGYSKEIRELKQKAANEMKELWRSGDFKKLMEVGNDYISELPSKPVGIGDKDISSVYLLHSTAVWELTKNKDEALKYALKSAAFDRKNKAAMWLIREINSHQSEKTTHYRIEVEGRYYAPVKKDIVEMPFLTLYGVVAESPEEAMDYIKQFERDEIKDTIKFREAKELEPKPDIPKGIYSTHDLVALPEEEDEAENQN